jgi:hypothetical protein
MTPESAIHADPALSPGARPFRRKVFYIPGYDPFPPRRYRELYRKEGARQAQISGYALDLKPMAMKNGYGWRVRGPEGAEAEVEVLVWTDLVRDSMDRGILATYGQMIRTAWAYIGSGALFRLMRLRKGPTIAALYPVAVLILQAVVALGLALALTRLTPWAWAVAPVVVWGVLAAFRRADSRIFAWYLMHDYAYSAQAGGANPPALERRMQDFTAKLRAALEADVDEVLLVGHSSGAHLGVSVLADLIRAGLPARRPALGFLTLGQVVPMVSFLPGARRLRADLAFLSARDELTWIDVTAPGDGCAFALCDPVGVTGVAPPDQRWPLVVSAAFTRTLSAETWKRLRWRFFRLHFQYLCAFDRPGDYDYFQITAGPLTLADRYRGRAPSKSRITAAASEFRDT